MINIINTAKEYAISAHQAQLYGKNVPYSKHLEDVVETLHTFGLYSDIIIAAAWLHDVLEDTNTPHFKLLDLFGNEIYNIVYAVTEPICGNRKYKHSVAYPVIRKNPMAIIIKLADRIANVTARTKNKMYKKEHILFKHQLFVPYSVTEIAMWKHLDSLILNL